MRNRDMPAHLRHWPPGNAPPHDGLTKREAAAIAAMQGILASPYAERHLEAAEKHGTSLKRFRAALAVQHADALFDELEKPNE